MFEATPLSGMGKLGDIQYYTAHTNNLTCVKQAS